ncbi:MAG: hypothetical protein ACI8YQ_001023 [Polaribacter sp.]|jgi:hypothetical protein
MIISFDIDETLISHVNEFQSESPTIRSRIFKTEKIRKGTIKLFQKIKEENHEIWIYTTSFRSQLKLRLTFFAYGLYPTKFINETLNRKALKKANCTASKNPNLFGIDIHVDDSEGVRIEGERYEFKTIIVKPDDINWQAKVLAACNLKT